MNKRIGFMGLGIMGLAMAENVLRNGFSLTVYNRTKNKAALLAELGATVVATPRELAEASDVVVVMVTGPEAVYALLTGKDGCAMGMDESKVFVNMGTVSPAYAREIAGGLAPLGVTYVDAPVSGSKRPAEEGTLIILAGGPQETVKELEPLFLAMGKKVVHCGAVGQGSMAKMAVNMHLGTVMESMAETLELGRRGGLDEETLLDILEGGVLNSPLLAMKREMLTSGYFPAQFPLKHMAKDMKYVLDSAWEIGAAVPCASAALSVYGSAKSKGLGDMDFAAVIKTLQDMAGDKPGC